MATDAEKEELAEAYERYKAQSKRLKEAIRQRVKEIVEDEYAREDQKNKAEFGRQLGLSNLSVRERQEVLKTRDWGTYKAFMDAAGMPTSARFTPVNLPDEDVTTVAGVRCTTGPRTLIDLAGRFSASARIELVDAAIGAGIVTRPRLYERATALRNGRAGVGTIVEITAPDAEGVFRSTLERRFSRGVRRAGLPRPEVNRPLRLHGRLYVPDALWPSHGLVTELHGLRFHSTPAQRGRDDERLNAFTELGLRVLVFSWQQVLDDFGAVAATLRRALGVSPERPAGALR